MKKVSKIGIEMILAAINSVTGLQCIMEKEVPCDSKASADAEGNVPETEAVTSTVKKVLTNVGSTVVDIFTTIDRINNLDVTKTRLVDGEHAMSDYEVLDVLTPFIRPAKAIYGGETQGIKQKDHLVAYASICDTFRGEVLSPEGLKHAQLKLLRAMNKKCTALVGTVAVKREVIVLTENELLTMPVLFEGSGMASVTRSTGFELHALKNADYEEDEYVVSYSQRFVSDNLESIVVAIVAAASRRSE